MVMLKNVTGCSTKVVRELDKQLIARMNLLVPNTLVSFADLKVVANGEAVWPLLQPAAKMALKKAIDERGKALLINSGYRTIAQQLILFNNQSHCGITANPPGKSNHQSGLALDIQDYEGWKPFLTKYGWKWFGSSDPVHFDFVGGSTKDIRNIAVKAFQQLWNLNHPDETLTVDGIYGNLTNDKLNQSPIEGFAKGEKSSVNLLMRILRLTQPYMEGEDVRQLQEALIKINFSVKADGVFGLGTNEVVKKFQQDKGLNPDGIVGLTTIEKLGLLA